MAKQKPSIPQGTRDFSPEVMVKRNFIFDTVKKVFQKFGFLPLETPAMEKLEVLTGKYGEEGDQLIFKILNSGDFLSKTTPADIEEGSKKLSFKISEKALRYDLTVPFARFVAMNQGTLSFPFKRYQIQPVWRGDAPQRGRYREFYQCDADVVGTNSIICEAEIVLMINEVMQNLNIGDISIKINHRKILSGIAEVIGAKGNESSLFVAIDKLDKVSKEKVIQELIGRGFTEDSIKKLEPFFENPSLEQLKTLLADSETGKKGIEEIEQMYAYLDCFEKDVDYRLDFSPLLARGLSYYTGAIFEVKANNVSIGSICGGGRYDNLTGAFGLPDMSGVGISFGIDRIYDVMEELQLFPDSTQNSTQALLVNFDSESEKYVLGVLKKLRDQQIACEIYPTSVKLDKQLKYANAKKIPFVILIGSDEINTGLLTIKDMSNRTEEKLKLEDIILKLKK